MRRFIIPFLLLGLTAVPVSSSGSATDKSKEDKAISEFFSGRTKGESATYQQDKKLKTKGVQSWQKRVWSLWKEAQKGLRENTLRSLNTLSSMYTGKWNMPEGLEPNSQMPYFWFVKGEIDTVKALPLFVYLHGSGPKDMEWATGVKLARIFDDALSAYFIPQIPNEGEYYRWWQKGKQQLWEQLLRQALASDEINPNKVYFFGISEGGYGSQRLASFYADYLAGAGPMAGGEPLKNAPAENCANIAFSFLTGAKDYGFYRNILTSYTKEAFDSLQQKHPGYYQHRIELIPERGHSIDYRPTTPWLKQYTRNPHPKYVCWEDYPMDGRHRDGFYNLAVTQRPDKENTEARTRYEMAVSGNIIRLTIDKVTYQTIQKDPNWGIEMKFNKTYEPATGGKLTVYLCDELVDLRKDITVIVNGRQAFHGKVQANVKHMVNSVATFFDPCRVYPAAVEISF